MRAMENNTCLPLNQISNESKLILKIRASKNEFENQLLDDTWEQDKVGYNSSMLLSRFWLEDFKPINFFRSCCYKFHHKMTIFKLSSSYSLFNTYKNVQINGYSALGAAMMANDISPDVKRNFIQELVNLNFKPTAKDIELAELYLYDAICTITKEKIILLLCDHQKDNLPQLLPEIRTQIAYHLIQLFKNEFWLIPEKSGQKEEDITYCIRAGIVETI